MHRARPLLISLGVLLSALSARADGIYQYTQSDGTIVYTNAPPSGVGLSKLRRVSGHFTPAPRPSDPPVSKPGVAVAFDEFVKAAAERYKIPVALVQAVMHAESNFNLHAISNRGAVGLMQLMPFTAEEMYVHDMFDAQQNIEGGVRYLRVLANMFNGDMVKMVAAYNAGPDAVRKAGGGVPDIAETRDYVTKVIALYHQYKQAGAGRVAQTP
jgi:soluble lytic murein transglycosylase-like protein